MTAVTPTTKAARHAQIAAILGQAAAPVRSQEELADRLLQRGVRVTQATLSRDLEELGAVRLRGPGGALRYALPDEPGGPGSPPGGVGAAGLSPTGPAGPEVGAAAAPGAAAGGEAGAGGGTGTSGGAGAGAEAGAGGEITARLARVTGELLLAAESSANLVVLRTPAGAAQFLASVLDHAAWPAILGTVAGDDTVLVIARDPVGGQDLADALLRLAQRRAHAGPRP